jgi:zinc transporter ZupT
MSPLLDASGGGIHLAVLSVTAVGVCGAVSGVILTSRATPLGQLLPFSSGLLLGMALFLLLPEALSNSKPAVVLGFCAAGCFMFGLVEAALHSMHESPHSRTLGMIPLICAIGLHCVLDGWNIAIAVALPSVKLVWAFLIGMSVHKLTGGAAAGAILLSAAPRRNSAIFWAALCECLTAVGAVLQLSTRQTMGTKWTVSLMCLTAGSFLYLGYHSFQSARGKSGFRSAVFPALLGMGAIWIISLLR